MAKAMAPGGPYKFARVEEGFIGTLLLGGSYIKEESCEQAANEMAAKGYELCFMALERRRKYMFWQVESLIMAFRRRGAGTEA